MRRASFAAVCPVSTSTGAPSARPDKSPRITCSVPSIRVQGTLSAGASGVDRGAAIGDLDPLIVADARFEFGTHRLAVFVEPTEGLVAVMDQRVERQCLDVGTFDDHLDVGVHPGQKLAIGVLKVDLGAKRATLLVERPGNARDGGRQLLVAERCGQNGRLGADVDEVGILFRDVDEDPDNVETVDHVDRRGPCGRNVRRQVKGRRVAGGGQDEIEGVGVAGGDDAGERCREREVADPRLRKFLLAVGHFQVGFHDSNVHLGLQVPGFGGEQFRLRPLDGRLCLFERRHARLELIGRLEKDAGIDYGLR